jgi:hypothetical protein
MKPFRQILAIARTEFRFGFRRGGPVAVVALIGLSVSAGIVFMTVSMGSMIKEYSQAYERLRHDPVFLEQLSAQGLTFEKAVPSPSKMLENTLGGSLAGGWLPFPLLAFILIPMLAAPTLPADHAVGVAELMRSTPISGGTYLAGKVLGVIASVLLTAAAGMLLYSTVTVVIYGIFPFTKLALELTLLDGLPVIVGVSGLGVLIGTPMRRRSSASLIGMVSGVLSLILWMLPSKPWTDAGLPFDLAAYSVFQRNLMGMGEGTPAIATSAIVTMYVYAIIVLALIAVLARLWLRRKENF